MNSSALVFVASDAVRAILCSYSPSDKEAFYEVDERGRAIGDDELKGSKPVQFKTTDESIKKGDFVVVPTKTRHGMTVVRVEEVDVPPNVDGSREIPWVVGKVSVTDLRQLEAWEKEVIAGMRTLEVRKMRRDLREQMGFEADEVPALPGSAPLTLEGPSGEDTTAV